MPARSQVKYGLIFVEFDAVYTAGTDGYAAGTDWADVNDSDIAPGEGIKILVDKEGLTALDKAARESKKAPASITVEDGSVSFQGEGEPVTVPTFEDEHTLSVYEAIGDMIRSAEGRPPVIPGVLCIDPSLLSKFAKVKADKTDRRADLYMTETYEPVLVKVGPTFKGLLMPIEREVHAESVGADGLW